MQDNDVDSEFEIPEGGGLLEFLIAVAKQKKVVLGVTFGATLLSVVIALILPVWYEGTTRVLPPQQPQSSISSALGQLGALVTLAGGSGSSSLAKNPSDMYIGMLKSRTVTEAIVKRFDLMKVYNKQYISDARDTLEEHTTIKSGKDSIIVISVEDREPPRAAQLANAYIEELNKLMQSVAVTEAAQRRLFYERQLAQEKTILANAEAELKRTQETTGLLRLDDQSRLIIQNLAQLQALARSKEVRLAAMRSFATDENPEYVRTQQELTAIRGQIERAEKQQGGTGRDGIFVPSGKIPEVGIEYVRRLRDVKYHEALFEFIARQFESAKIDEAREGSQVQVIDTAVDPERKSRPKRTLIVLVTAFLALFVGVVVAIFRESLERAREQPAMAAKWQALRESLKFR